MTKELETWCQLEVETLLKQKEHFLKNGLNNGNQCDLPHYKTILSLYESLEQGELFLLEINDKLQTLQREKEIKNMKAAFSSIRLSEALKNETPKSFIRTWLKEILLHDRKEKNSSENNDEYTEKLFFDIDFHETAENETLTWSTLYKGRCIRASVSAPSMCVSTDPTDYSFSASFYVDGLVNIGQDYISSGMSAEDYTRILWKMSSNVITLAKTLEGDDKEQHKEAYTILGKISDLPSDCDVSQYLPSITASLKRDFIAEDKEIANAAFQSLSNVIKVLASLETSKQEGIYAVISAVISEALYTTATSETIKEHFLSIVSQLSCQKFFQIIHDVTFKDAKKTVCSVVQEEAINFALNLMQDKENGQTNMETSYVKILQVFLAFSASDSDVVREISVNAAHLFISSFPIKPTHIAPIASCLKVTIMPKIKSVYSKSATMLCEVLTHQWPLFLKIMGVNIRKSSSLINALLAIVEKGFRHSQTDVKTASFKAWDCLIECLAEDTEILASTRYMKLLMQPLTTMQSADVLNITRIETLWGLAKKLGPKLPMLFTTVCLPILHCCLGSLDPERLSKKNLDNAVASSMKARRASSHGEGFYAALHASGYRATLKKVSQSRRLQIIGVEILVQLLNPTAQCGEDESEITKKFYMPKLDFIFLSSTATFVSHGQLFITAVSEVLCYLTGISQDLARVLWRRLHHHVKFHLETNLKKKKREPELFNSLLLLMQNVINAESLPDKFTFEMLESFLDLPSEILSSTFFGGSLNGVHGVPALYLLKLIFSKRFIPTLIPGTLERTVKCANSLMKCGFQNNVRILTSSQSVVDILEGFVHMLRTTRYEKTPDLQSNFTLLVTVWENLGKELDAHILKSQEVNQGDSLDHDFSALYAFLLLPISLDISGRNCVETWTQVYKTFLWCSGFVTTCKPNEICDYIASVILKQYSDKWPMSAILLIADICKYMVSTAEYNHSGFNEFGKVTIPAAVSCIEPAVSILMLDRHKNLAMLSAIILLLFKFSEKNPNLEICEASMRCLSHLFTSIHHPADIRSFFKYFLFALKTSISAEHINKKLFNEQFESIFRAALKAFANPDEVRSLLQEDSFFEFAMKCMEQKDRKIRNIFFAFWQDLVVSSPQHSTFCESFHSEFKSNIFPVYKQMGWDCPWKDIELPNSIDLTDASKSQNESTSQSMTAPAPGYGAFGSPVKNHSFLSPRKSPVQSPLKTPVKTPSSVKRKLNSSSENVTYVKCSSPFPKPKTPLTKHQKEKLREKGFIPAMYNDLDDIVEQNVEMQTQEDEEVESQVDEDKEKSSSENEQAGTNTESIIESSQSQEVDKKRAKTEKSVKRKRRISLKNMATVQDKENQDLSLNESIPVRRSGRIKKINQESEKSVVKDAKKAKVHEEEEEAAATESEDSLLGNQGVMDDNEMESTTNTENDVSYEYVEIADTSTNQTRNNITVLDESDDGKDLGVTPLDESYEYVEVADVSAYSPHFKKSSGQNNNDLMDTDGESEYEAVATSTNLVVSLESVDQSFAEENQADHKDPLTSDEHRRLRKNQSIPRANDFEKHDTDEHNPSECEDNQDGDSTLQKESDQTLNTTEYEYVAVADMSVTAAKQDSLLNQDNSSPIEKTSDAESANQAKEDGEFQNPPLIIVTDVSRNEESVYVYSSLISEDGDDEDEFIDARSSLGANSTALDDSRSEVFSVSGESSTSGDLFNTSTEENNKSMNEQSAISIRDSSESDGEKEADNDFGDVEMDIAPLDEEDECDSNKSVVEGTSHSPNISRVHDDINSPTTPDAPSKQERAPLLDVNETSPTVKIFKIPSIAAHKSHAMLPRGESPSAKGILKRRISVEMPPEQSPGNKRRVSFAKPISNSKLVDPIIPADDYPQSPRSSLMHCKRHSPRVSRRLSLQPDRKSNDVQVSPLSLRSVHVAEAIANIKAKDSNSPSRLSNADKKRTHQNDSKINFRSISVKDLENPEFLKSLSKAQLDDLLAFLINAMPIVHDASVKAFDTQDTS